MGVHPEFRPEENKALLPWRDYHFSGVQIAAAIVGLVALVLGAAFIDGGDPLYHIVAAVILGALLLAVFLSSRDWATSEAVALDSAGIVAPTGWGRTYVRWT